MKRLILTTVAALTLFFGANAQSKIGHINSSELMNLMPEMKDFETKMKDHETKLRATLEEMQKQLQIDYDNYVNDSTSLAPMMEVKKANLENLQANIQKFSQSAEQDLMKKKEELYMPIYKRAKVAIDEVAKAKGFDYVLDSSQGLGVLVTNAANDLMAEVKKKLGIL